jgi:predicted RNase H-like HicB family nuclease
MSQQRFLIVIEGGGESNFSAYSPDLPGVAATGTTRERCESEMRRAIEFHVEGLGESGGAVPPPHSAAG